MVETPPAPPTPSTWPEFKYYGADCVIYNGEGWEVGPLKGRTDNNKPVLHLTNPDTGKTIEVMESKIEGLCQEKGKGKRIKRGTNIRR